MSLIESKLSAMGLELPEHVAPAGSYLVGYKTGNLVFTSAVGPRTNDSNITGVMGLDCSEEDGYEAARRTCLRILSNVKSIIGDLDKITLVVKIFGCSDLLVELYGEAGKHARSSMGVTRNPFDGVISIDAIFEVTD